MEKKSKNVLSLAEVVQKHLRARESGKKAYRRAERMLDELLERVKDKEGLGAEIALAGGKRARIVDLYAEKNKVFRAHGIGRYEIEVVEE